MNRYTIYCTEEQTKKALKLGAPIIIYSEEYDNSNKLDNDIYIINDIVFSYNEDTYRNEEGDLVCIVGEEPNRKAYYVPTAEQMIGWLEEQGVLIYLHSYFNVAIGKIFTNGYSSYKEATLAAIDTALDYLNNNKK